MPAAHRRDPLAVGHVAAPCGERLLDLADGSRVLEDGVVARPIGQAHDVHMGLDQSGDDRSSAEVDRAHVRNVAGRGVADRNESPVPDGDHARDSVPAVHRVDAAVHERERFIDCGRRGRRLRRSVRSDLRGSCPDSRRGRRPEELLCVRCRTWREFYTRRVSWRRSTAGWMRFRNAPAAEAKASVHSWPPSNTQVSTPAATAASRSTSAAIFSSVYHHRPSAADQHGRKTPGAETSGGRSAARTITPPGRDVPPLGSRRPVSHRAALRKAREHDLRRHDLELTLDGLDDGA